MPSLLSDLAVRVSHFHMERNEDQEHFVTTFVAAIQNVYLHEPTIINGTEKPPSLSREDRLRRVDSITHWCMPGTWDLNVGAVWECKRPNASPHEIEVCEGQVFDACSRVLKEKQTGRCYGFCVIGSLWKVFVFTQPGMRYECVTGDVPDADRKYYFDVSDDSEAMMMDSCLRDLREHMGFQRDNIRADAFTLYPASGLNTAQAKYFFQLKRDGWTYEPIRRQFMRREGGAEWITHDYQFPVHGLR